MPDGNPLSYENEPVKLVALRKIPRIETPGITVAEVEERSEFETPYWIAHILIDAGLAKIIQDGLTPDEWTQTHFKERFNPAGAPSPLPKGFYRRAYLSITEIGRRIEGDQSKLEQLNRTQARYRDILESRLGKIIRIAATETTPPQGVLQPEEIELYRKLLEIISSWRAEMKGKGVR